MKNDISIAILGFGRFGRLLAGLLEKDGQVHIVSRSKIADKKFKQIKIEDLKNMDWVILSVPISAMEEALKMIKPYLKPGALVMDVCSVKIKPGQWMRKILPKNVEILGTHPMFGPDSIKIGLDKLSMVFCPERINPKRFQRIKDIFAEKKLRCLELSPRQHDQEAALSLSLVHFIGRGLSLLNASPLAVSTLGFERLLKVNETVSNDSWELFVDMHKYNPFAGKFRKKYLKALFQLDRKISQR